MAFDWERKVTNEKIDFYRTKPVVRSITGTVKEIQAKSLLRCRFLAIFVPQNSKE